MCSGEGIYGNASLDHIFGNDLKFRDSFYRTHLGWKGNKVARDETEVGK